MRVISGSDYDHVGMLVRGDNRELFVVEALAEGGVQIHEFTDHLIFCWHDCYKTVSFRKLECERDGGFDEKVARKTVEWTGIPYSLGVGEITRQVTTGQHKSFFCSELIAAMYKFLGFIPQARPTNQLWPSSFGRNLPLINARLGEISYVVYNTS